MGNQPGNDKQERQGDSSPMAGLQTSLWGNSCLVKSRHKLSNFDESRFMEQGSYLGRFVYEDFNSLWHPKCTLIFRKRMFFCLLSLKYFLFSPFFSFPHAHPGKREEMTCYYLQTHLFLSYFNLLFLYFLILLVRLPLKQFQQYFIAL